MQIRNKKHLSNYLRVTQMVCQLLDVIWLKLILIVQYMVVCWTRSSLHIRCITNKEPDLMGAEISSENKTLAPIIRLANDTVW